LKVQSKRHILKTITWRFIATSDTILIAWVLTENLSFSLKIGSFEVITKMVLYYLHERFWLKSMIKNSSKRHLFKTFSWRAIGTLDTIFLSWIITGNPLAGLKIGSAEVMSKMLLYYGHEKLWYKINYGLDNRNKSKILKDSKIK
jgi:uncharacterized membrane protein